ARLAPALDHVRERLVRAPRRLRDEAVPAEQDRTDDGAPCLSAQLVEPRVVQLRRLERLLDGDPEAAEGVPAGRVAGGAARGRRGRAARRRIVGPRPAIVSRMSCLGSSRSKASISTRRSVHATNAAARSFGVHSATWVASWSYADAPEPIPSSSRPPEISATV